MAATAYRQGRDRCLPWCCRMNPPDSISAKVAHSALFFLATTALMRRARKEAE